MNSEHFDDLDRLLFGYTVWANRLLPRAPFVEVVDRLETVGAKREVQARLRNLRNGLWNLNTTGVTSEFVSQVDDEDTDGHEDLPEDYDIPFESLYSRKASLKCVIVVLLLTFTEKTKFSMP
ncbi:unnamed protein product [Protopolystoma xenopodis]|uniref:TIMELESS-interacting protein n=1 Tax=Protopolystoma xenopodis TaxID=117903 RepID=A0A448WSZ4_9PLAT|nr:unnamed protein product [Protopolystoma xenopodis]